MAQRAGGAGACSLRPLSAVVHGAGGHPRLTVGLDDALGTEESRAGRGSKRNVCSREGGALLRAVWIAGPVGS